ncbi:MAG: hypothetical protein A2Y38_14990 [Spirochaetes bacterium GWB1_59_5]|nr:MAG: hypothetical protein A2Y38_14990 [Spirochaetes bacterium GWB1_59_5]
MIFRLVGGRVNDEPEARIDICRGKGKNGNADGRKNLVGIERVVNIGSGNDSARPYEQFGQGTNTGTFCADEMNV